jgi:hypothetical protein
LLERLKLAVDVDDNEDSGYNEPHELGSSWDPSLQVDIDECNSNRMTDLAGK